MAAPNQQTTLPHRAVSSIRGSATTHINTTVGGNGSNTITGGGHSSYNSASGVGSATNSGGHHTSTHSNSGGNNPRTPLRTIPPMTPTFSSPSSLRAEDEVLIIEFGARTLRVGFAGDAAPKAAVGFGPELARRVGDFRRWEVPLGGSGADGAGSDDWRKRAWSEDHELWRADVRGLDLGLVGDRMERALREAFNKYLLIDSRPRRVVAVLPSGTPLPLLATALATLFNRFHTPAVSLMSSSIACAVSAGVRSTLVVDMGWAETVVTAVYEYREVQSSRSVRAGKMLVEKTHNLLATSLVAQQPSPASLNNEEAEIRRVISFEECEEVATRLAWCKPIRNLDSVAVEQNEGLPTVTEQDETESSTAPLPTNQTTSTFIPLKSITPPRKVEVTYEQLSMPAETTFFDSERPIASFDDDELPLPLLIYRSLLKLPIDVRGICMARIIFTGGCSKVLGLRSRILAEVNTLVQNGGWDPVQGKAVEAYKTNPSLRQAGNRTLTSESPHDEGGGGGGGGHEQDGVWVDAASDAQQEPDPVEQQLRRKEGEKRGLQGQLRVIESLGAWSGGSLLSLLKVPAVAMVEREAWREHGPSGASRPSEVEQKAAQRQSMGTGGLIRGSAGANWTLGVWGYL
ncbi:hypothetical protein BD289DRAFT_428661 [Coniella lustricola]|uniref:Actin-domain-containing protein n=1 Tax=Coniella lustricola TaxID=2025994 RepID=A0A2T3AE01_9PEZI|nr:hypothetical protein BD289DRAFT_428661 [Coniella lustricola]